MQYSRLYDGIAAPGAKRRYCALLFVCAALAFAACGKDGKSGAPTAMATTDSTTTPDSAVQETDAPAAKPVRESAITPHGLQQFLEWVFSPRPYFLRQYLPNNFPAYEDQTKIHIYGWAKNGRVAYFSNIHTDNAGGTLLGFAVFDFVDDKQIFELRIGDYFAGNQSPLAHGGDWKTEAEFLYKKYGAEISAALTKYDIVERQAEFLPFPLSKGGAVYEASVRITRRIDKDCNPIQDYDILVAKNNGKSRVITSHSEPAEHSHPWGGCEAVAVCGYFLSPFENRALVVIARASFGPSHCSRVRYDFSGCHLDIGF